MRRAGGVDDTIVGIAVRGLDSGKLAERRLEELTGAGASLASRPFLFDSDCVCGSLYFLLVCLLPSSASRRVGPHPHCAHHATKKVAVVSFFVLPFPGELRVGARARHTSTESIVASCKQKPVFCCSRDRAARSADGSACTRHWRRLSGSSAAAAAAQIYPNSICQCIAHSVAVPVAQNSTACRAGTPAVTDWPAGAALS